MNTNRRMRALSFVYFVSFVVPAFAATTIDPANPYAYGTNMGWINAEADGANGAVIGQAFCSGYMYGANVGWIHLGDGAPVNGMAYANDSATDYGVNHDGLGSLSGYAYGANIGWINFEQTHGQPQVNLETGDLSGYVPTGGSWGTPIPSGCSTAATPMATACLTRMNMVPTPTRSMRAIIYGSRTSRWRRLRTG